MSRTIVITGASAGVGRAVAVACGRRGDRVALIARSRPGLDGAAAEVTAAGGEVLVQPCDVADADAVERAANHVEAAFGPIDVWVNAAMVTVFSPVERLTAAEVRRVTDVTYLGNVHGTLAALARMRRRDRGTIIQVGSALAYRGIPLQAPYCGAKHALRGFQDSVEAELRQEGSRVRLCMVQIPAVNTPQFDWARSHVDGRPRPMAPVYQPEAVAAHILAAMDRPRREVWVGAMTPLVAIGSFLAPAFADWYLARTAMSGQTADEPPPAVRPDNLYGPAAGLHRTRGRFDAEAAGQVIGADAGLWRWGVIALLTGTVAAATAGLAARRLAPGPRLTN